MSIRVMTWAMNDAPVDDPGKVLLLVAMGDSCNEDGTACYQSVARLAEKARVSVRTVQRELRLLEDAGVIRRGDQQLVAHFPSNRRPVVWDLNIKLRRDDKVSPQKANPGVTETGSRGDTEESRGDTGGTSGVTRMADNTSLEPSLLNSSINNSPALFEPPGGEVAVISNPARLVAQDVHEKTKGAYAFKATYGIVDWAMKAGYSGQDVHRTIGNLWNAGRPLTKALLGQALEGIVKPLPQGAKPSTTDAQIRHTLSLKEKYLAQEAMQEGTTIEEV